MDILAEQERAEGYTKCGGNGDNYQPLPNTLIEAAVQMIERQDVAGQALAATLKESEFIKMDLLRDDVGWRKISTTANNLDMPPQMRKFTVWRARQFTRFNGIVKQMLALYTNFGIGTGFGWDVIDKDESGGKAKEVLDTLIKANPKTFKSQGQRLNSDALYTDGEMFFVLFAGTDSVKIRTIDPMEMVDIITDPDDKATPILYARRFMRGMTEKVKYYLDWNATDLDTTVDDIKIPTGLPALTADNVDDGVVYHAKLRGRGTRGESGFTADMDWSAQYSKFMTARAAITLAIASLAYKLKVKGGAGNIAAIQSQVGSALDTSSGSGETNPPAASGSTWLENQGAELSAMKQETGAAAAKVDAGLFLQAAGVGSGIYPQYLGSNSFRLATATAMEPPMMKAFEAYQGLWVDVYETIIRWVWDEFDVPEAEQNLNTTAPPIQEINKTGLVDSVQKLVATFPKLGDSDDLIQWALAILGMNDADELLKALEMDSEPPSTREAFVQNLSSVLREVVHNGRKGTES